MTTLLQPTPSQDRTTDDSVLGRVRAHLPEIAARSAQAEAARAVPTEIITALREAGVFRMSLPRVWAVNSSSWRRAPR
ncbi:hypothetical protein STAFG_6829 [Streptomyces afghaniensis 772]|uniref:Acyl-CoA dehydrogenase/oxidase N-terminal domain-containing protein n=1 Tax=Streptomyces afghaniensis 772 TaxID=1283301 RepID=S4ND26_9ACTN|nr:hypothetical protein [Streptomyces afghaniensis]EPJ36149.1 hypothetical protein STAFG_6829 [Streptomyces afghaniensis 772]